SSPFPRLTMNVGARYERNEIITPDSSTNDAQPVFKAGVNYRIAAFTYLRASYGEAYRFPTIAEKYISNTAGAIKFFPNPFLFPENGWGVELGVKQGFSIGALKGLFDFSVFWNEYSDMMEIVFGCQGPNCKSLFEGPLNSLGFATINIGDTRIKGLEGSLLLSGKIGNVNLNVLTGYTYIDPRFLDNIELQTRFSSSDKNLLKYRFRHVYKGDLEARYQGFFLGTDVFYNSFMEAIDVAFSDGLPDLKKYRAKHDFGDWVFGGRLGYQAESGSRFSFIVKNLLNEEYTVRPALFEAPRNYTVKVEWVIK
ncbi:MAG: outer membrane receptor protein involved in Fe transport, partial [Sphingobacteriales bacterium]